DLKYRSDVETAILSHHRTGGGDLADKLREADRNARRKELADNLVTKNDIFQTPAETETEKKPADSSDLNWMDISEYLAELNNRINVLNGTRFEAFSMKDG